MGLDLYAQFLQVLYDRAINGTSQVGVLIRNDTSLVPYTVVDVLRCLSEFKVRDCWKAADRAPGALPPQEIDWRSGMAPE